MANLSFSIAIIDDDPMLSQMVEDLVKRKFPDAHAHCFATGEDAFASGLSFDLVILDYQLDSSKADALNGIQVLVKFKEQRPEIPVVFLSAQDRLEVATNCIKFGAYDYIVKNDTAFAKLENTIHNIQTVHGLRRTSSAQRVLNRIFWILIGLFIVYILYLKF